MSQMESIIENDDRLEQSIVLQDNQQPDDSEEQQEI